ncbi:MAG TPA: diacylglycerol kinase family protein [Gemmatimonadaceae bacterium]
MSSVFLIVNPAAGRGRIQRILPDIFAAFREVGTGDIYETSKPGEEADLALRALNDGASTIVAVGGDGTCSGIANAILQSGSRCCLAVVPVGTGNDFAKTLGVGKDSPEQIAGLVQRGQESRIDVGLADRRYFLNSCGFGFDPSVLEATNNVRFLKGDAVYIYAALRQLFTYRGTELAAAGVPGVKRSSMLMVTASNGRWLGGAFKIAPQASVVDGKLDLCFFTDSNVFERVRLFIGAMRGTHLGMPSVRSASVRELTLTFPAPPSMEVDGELRRARSKTIELRCVPRALSVIAAPGAIS